MLSELFSLLFYLNTLWQWRIGERLGRLFPKSRYRRQFIFGIRVRSDLEVPLPLAISPMMPFLSM